MLTYRRATEADTATIALLARVTFTEAHEHIIQQNQDLTSYLDASFSIETLKKELQNVDNLFWLAFKNDFPVGYAKLVLNSDSEFINANKVCRFQRLYVLNEFLNLKIGSALQNLVFKKAIELNFDWIWLTVSVENYTAINFYTKNSYKNRGLIRFSIASTKYDNTVFAKQLK